MESSVDFCQNFSRNHTFNKETAEVFRLTHMYLSLAIGLVGFTSNTVVTVSILRHQLKDQRTDFYLLNMSVNNQISCILTLGGFFAQTATCFMVTIPGLCKAFGFINLSLMAAEMSSLLLIGINRYIRIVRPDIYSR